MAIKSLQYSNGTHEKNNKIYNHANKLIIGWTSHDFSFSYFKKIHGTTNLQCILFHEIFESIIL